MINDEEKIARVWYIVLCKSKARHWAINWMINGHVYAARKSPAATIWSIVDPTTTIVEVSAIPVAIMPNAQDYSEHATKVIRCVIEPNATQGFRVRFGLLTCVTIMKALLSVSGWRIVSPDQLGDYLIRSGIGRVVWSKDDGTDITKGSES